MLWPIDSLTGFAAVMHAASERNSATGGANLEQLQWESWNLNRKAHLETGIKGGFIKNVSVPRAGARMGYL